MDWAGFKTLLESLQVINGKKLAATICTACGLLLAWPENPHTEAIRNEYMNAIWITFFSSLAVLVVESIGIIIHAVKKLLRSRKQKRVAKKKLAVKQARMEEQERCLDALTGEEKDIICRYVSEGVVILPLNFADKAVYNLAVMGLIRPVSSMRNGVVLYHLSDTAINYLDRKRVTPAPHGAGND